MGEDGPTRGSTTSRSRKRAPCRLAGSYSLGELCGRVGGLDLFPDLPYATFEALRRWAFEPPRSTSRCAGASRSVAVSRDPRPVDVRRLHAARAPAGPRAGSRCSIATGPRFKLDPTNTGANDLMASSSRPARSTRLTQGPLPGTPVDEQTDPVLYRGVRPRRFPKPGSRIPTSPTRPPPSWSPTVTASPGTRRSIRSPTSRPSRSPKMVNIKPSRFGALRASVRGLRLLRARGHRRLRRRAMGARLGRGHIQYLASLFHPDTPNDMAPTGTTSPTRRGPPDHPARSRAAETGFRWADDA